MEKVDINFYASVFTKNYRLHYIMQLKHNINFSRGLIILYQ